MNANQWSTPNAFMTAVKAGLCTTTERFASPLNFNPQINCYCSMYKENQLFGANHDAFSCKWTGSSQAHPECSAEVAEKVVRWAIFSAQQNKQPALTFLMLQRRANEETSYTRWLSHPMVQELTMLNKDQIKLNSPGHWSGVGHPNANAKSDTCCLIVANTAGLKAFLKPETLKQGLQAAAINARHPAPVINHIRTCVNDHISLHGLYPPKYFNNADLHFATSWAAHNTVQQDLNLVTLQSTSLLHDPENIIYTDGSKKRLPRLGIVTGSRVYRQCSKAPLNLKIHPYNTGMLNTINRAELAAISVALKACKQQQEECIATDSVCSMQKINKSLRAPSQIKYDCHRPLLQAIASMIVTRAQQGVPTKVIKVKSHIGIHGNEQADRLANEAAEECGKSKRFDYDISQLYSEPFKDKFWLQRNIQIQTTEGFRTEKECLHNLHEDLKLHMHDKYKLGQSNHESILYKSWKNIQPYRDSQYSDAFRDMPNITESMKVTIDKCRTGTLGNNKRLHMMKLVTHKTCPICPSEDSIGHIMGGCSHTDMTRKSNTSPGMTRQSEC